MLSEAERVKAHAHRHLRHLSGYLPACDYSGELPVALADHEVVGVYVDRPGNALFVSTRGIYVEAQGLLIDYSNITALEVNHVEKGKRGADQILVTLSDQEVVTLDIQAGKTHQLQDQSVETRNVWTIYTFLLKVLPRPNLEKGS